nr:polyketide synthase dehydratase domain-containing protein [Desulfatitalea alkaliphila]
MLNLKTEACWSDHRFQERAVLPAVEALQVLADVCRSVRPELNLHRMGAARFDKFLALPPDGGAIAAYCDLSTLPGGGLRAALLSRIQAGAARIRRMVTHAQVVFMPDDGSGSAEPFAPPARATGATFSVDPVRLYEALVPFGPAYRNIVEPLVLDAGAARAVIQAPTHAGVAGSLGSPFVLDAAFHAACVWAQRFAGVVAFPVGFAQRHIATPTRPGQRYLAQVVWVGREGGTLLFDLKITDARDRHYEVLRGVAMRDVSGGRWVPPAWVRRGIPAEDQG